MAPTISVEQHPAISCFLHSAPVQVTALAEALGLSVWEDEDLPAGVSGKLFQDDFNSGPSGLVSWSALQTPTSADDSQLPTKLVILFSIVIVSAVL